MKLLEQKGKYLTIDMDIFQAESFDNAHLQKIS